MDVTHGIRNLEEQLLSEEVRRSEARLMDLLAPDFVEIGASGQIFSRKTSIEALREAQPTQYKLLNFEARLLASNVVLATYEVQRPPHGEHPPTSSLRSSIWVREGECWRLTFHQGTRRRDCRQSS